MTEEEWGRSSDPVAMLALFGGLKPTVRKLRLFGSGCCEAVCEPDWPKRSLEAIRAAERFADGAITEHELNRHRSFACKAAQNFWAVVCRDRKGPSTKEHERHSQLTLVGEITTSDKHLVIGLTSIYRVAQLRHDLVLSRTIPVLLRDIFGNPFRPVAFDSAWHTETVVGLARGIYEDRAFERMPILADALQDAGCEHPDILAHCREPGVHVRGCWVVDLLLGKS